MLTGRGEGSERKERERDYCVCDDNLSDVGALTSVLEMFNCVCLENHTLATNKQ